ncbi:hypothetical protein PV377_10990 [Streptomyces ipomoeae]|uniref:hypothetical protein n=1 Tax=Streptomyces ipomoeae TaxID=103232 RepID=UPI0029BDF702|nr:hypothetical protein [Streptomyces ipomoeae]MDX2839497.1 hypothetical protein [Streptomyces ipomoeae]
MKKHLTLVATTNHQVPDCRCGSEPCIVTGPNDPCTVGVQVDTDGVVHMTFGWHTDSNRGPIEISLDRHRADYIGDLLKKAVAMAEEREYAETAAWAAAVLAPCPLHDGPSVEGTHCTCDGAQDAYGNPVESTTS